MEQNTQKGYLAWNRGNKITEGKRQNAESEYGTEAKYFQNTEGNHTEGIHSIKKNNCSI